MTRSRSLAVRAVLVTFAFGAAACSSPSEEGAEPTAAPPGSTTVSTDAPAAADPSSVTTDEPDGPDGAADTDDTTEATTATTTAPSTTMPRQREVYSGPAWDRVVYLSHATDLDLDTVPWELLTDVIYSFVGLDGNGDLVTEPDDDSFDTMIPHLRRIRDEFPNLRLILAVGDGQSAADFPAVTTPDRVQATATSMLETMDEIDFDGLDIDWEFPTIGTDEPQQYVALLAALRAGLDERTAATGREFMLSTAVNGLPDWPEGGEGARSTPPEAAAFVDRWNVMTYDYAGFWNCGTESWRQGTDHLSQLFPTEGGRSETATAVGIMRWVAHGVPAAKIRMGLPWYAASWTGVKAGPSGYGIGQRCDPANAGRLWRNEQYAGTDAPEDCVNGVDPVVVAAWQWCASIGRFASFDTPETVAIKRQWALDLGLGGLFAWELSHDDPSFSMLRAMVGV